MRCCGLDQDVGEGSGDVTGVQVGLAVGDEVGEFLRTGTQAEAKDVDPVVLHLVDAGLGVVIIRGDAVAEPHDERISRAEVEHLSVDL